MTEITRETLKLAALAAGIKLVPCPQGVLRNCTGAHPAANLLAMPEWAPHLDDGDAFRLLVATGITLVREAGAVWVWTDDAGNLKSAGHDGTPTDAARSAREAIVLCAAEVGRRMREGEQ